MNVQKMILVCIGLSVSLLQVLAQKAIQPNLKFGAPTKEEMEISICPYDSSAKAMVLCSVTDVAYVYAANTFKVEYTIKKRIKILSQEGVDAANISIPYYSLASGNSAQEKLRAIKATAYNMENGKMVKTKMGNDLIFEERIDKKHARTKFTVPQAKAGTVIEYQYIKSSDFFYQIDDWYAQEEIPVLYASYEIVIPSMFLFNMEQGGANYLQNYSEPTSQRFSAEGDPTLSNRYTFTGRNLTALKSDKFVWCPSMYASKISFELRNISIPGQYYKNFTTTWKDIDVMLMDDDDFGGRIKRGNPLKDEMVAAKIDTISDFGKKLAATYLLLKKRVKWDGSYALLGNGARNVLKEGKASNADINFLLMNMLKALNIKTVPLVLSTRNKGMLPLSHPSVDALNSFVVGVYENDSVMHVMDGSAEYGYIDVLPPVLLTTAHAVNGEQVNLMNKAINRSNSFVTAELTSDGKLVGSMRTRYQNQASLAKKKSFLTAKDSADYVKDIAHRLDVTIKHYNLNGARKYSPLVEQSLDFEKELELSDVIYLNPVLDLPFDEVPFTAAERTLPVEFDSPLSESYMVRFKLPADYMLEEIPKAVFIRNSDNSAIFKMQFQLDNNILMGNYSFSLRKALFLQNEYPDLKAFMEGVFNKMKPVVVLKKKVQ